MIQLIRRLIGCNTAEEEKNDRLLGDMWLILGFKEPGLLDEITYQKEAMLTLIVRASKIRGTGKKRFGKPDDNELYYKYREGRNSYTDDVKVLRQIHPVFAGLPLHWSELPGFIRKWQKTVEVNLEQSAIETMSLLEKN